MIYNALRYILYPLIGVVAVVDSKKRDFFKKRFFQSLDSLSVNQEYIWIHCSSVGEVNLSDSLIKSLLKRIGKKILITTFTDTGYETAKSRYQNEEQIDILYFPLDDKGCVRKILKKIRVQLLIVIETEIWPNLIREVKKTGAKTIFVNGRISDRSLGKYKKLSTYLKNIFKNVDAFYMQTHRDAGRIIEIGATSSKVEVVGNLKFDIELTQYSEFELKEYKEQLGVGSDKIFVAGSTRRGEDEKLLEVFSKLENYTLILVPRHLERVEEIEKLIEKFGFSYKKSSEKNTTKKDIILVNEMGILRKLYAISDVAFVGGTLVNIGGHSLLEPLFYGKTPIFGPYIQNVKDIAEEASKRDIGYMVKTTEEFLKKMKKIAEEKQAEEKILEFFSENKDVVKKVTDRIENLIK
jgi:tRNA (guanine-N7-)-methyltransferase